MRPLLALASLALALGGCIDAGGGATAGAGGRAPEVVPVVAAPVPSGLADVAGVAARHLVRFEAPAPDLRAAIAAEGGEILWWNERAGLATVRGLAEAAARRLARRPEVGAVAGDVEVQLPAPPATVPVLSASADARADIDPSAAEVYALQWNMPAIRADEAWEDGFVGAPHVTVAVLDTGIDYRHRDLEGRVDLERSASFRPQDDALVAERFPDRHPITDLHLHGTHVAATIASNGVVAAGVTRSTTIVGVKVLGFDGKGSLSSVMQGFAHALDVGADVINMSLGDTISRSAHPEVIRLVEAELERAVDEGVTVVVAAGNDGRDLDEDPDSYDLFCDAPQVICVSATGPAAASSPVGPFEVVDHFASYSNYGESVDVAAPGGDAAYVWAACSGTSLQVPDCQGRDGMVVGLVGTSMAAPHASGLAALLVDARGRRPATVRAALEGRGDDLGEPGFDRRYGHGRIDVAAAVGLDAEPRLPADLR